jgi:AmmeMemoRadiSam system protein B/AmmeMemoRadiSam system protein A
MKKYFVILSLVVLVGVIFSCRQKINSKNNIKEKIRYAAVAGMFYPNSKYELSKMVEDFLKNAKKEKIEGKIIGIISPHAGYIYSGGVAGYSYKQIENLNFESVIILAPSHYVNFSGGAIYEKGYFRTPLGDVKVDEKLASSLKSKEIFFDESPHIPEHSLEVQIPFLQKIFPSLKIVPIIIGPATPYELLEKMSSTISEKIKNKNVLLIASTDMSHYHPYENAVEIDKRTISLIEKFDISGLYYCLSKGKCELCGEKPVLLLLNICKKLGANKVKVIKYANSGDVTGEKDRVVGYFSGIIFKEEGKKMREEFLNEEEKRELLKIARKTIEEYITERKIPEFKVEDEKLKKKCGAFVTLKKRGELRGCIGNIVGDKPLYITVRDMAIESATRDPRFMPVTKDELNEIEIEISVLTPLEKIDDYRKVIPGKHGVVIRRGFNSGVFLPQVATEQGWNREEFLQALCVHKAGLPKDAYKDKNTELYIFTAEVFSEKEFK